jgi:(E)-4-hydroxy-3-methylbut-2-enyl-diphosphate synthase
VRRKTRAVRAGGLVIGGDAPISVQTMWKEPLSLQSIPDVLSGIETLCALGCDLVRFAVPNAESAQVLGALAESSVLPLVADIHFDYRIALQCLDFPLAKIRINPGNIGEEWKVREVVAKASDNGIGLRIGVNAGSLPRLLQNMKNQAVAMVLAAESEMETLERVGFKDAVFSLKSSDVEVTIRANTSFSRRYDYPLHVGVTEAGPLVPGIVRNTLGVAALLRKGIGDTVRISLSASPQEEVLAAVELLRSLGVRASGARIISCPTCGRSSFDVKGFLEQVSIHIQKIRQPLVVAIMGCVVNGPGEATHADIGITGAGKMALIFKSGRVVRKVPFDNAATVFLEEIQKLCAAL